MYEIGILHFVEYYGENISLGISRNITRLIFANGVVVGIAAGILTAGAITGSRMFYKQYMSKRITNTKAQYTN